MTAYSYPDGPRTPKWAQAAVIGISQIATQRRLHKRYGDAFTIHVPLFGKTVVVAGPELIKQTFTASPDVLYTGERSPLRTVLGDSSLLTIDGARHLQQRRLLLPPFHGKRMRSYEQIVREEALRELDGWPEGEEMRTLEPMSRITLNAILRTVFGAEGTELEQLRHLLPGLVRLGSRLVIVPVLHRDLGRWSPWGRFVRMRRAFDAHVDSLIDTARAAPDLEQREDVLALLAQARHESGEPMSRTEIADQLLTLLVAGHETTAATLAWAVERLRRHPELLARLTDEARTGGGDLREATIRELQRTRPVIQGTSRFVMEPFELGPWRLEPGTTVVVSAVLTHEDPRYYADPLRFDPDRFLGAKPDTYEWVPFGGGTRRCIGAAFAQMEMDVVLRTLLERYDLATSAAPDERWRWRGVAFAPARGGRGMIRRPTGSAQGPLAASAHGLPA
ncbi:MAG TPA: cytochrome P450 [Thermoleophilaceae bacterium]